MTTRYHLGNCTRCDELDALLPYGDQDDLICMSCARLINEKHEPSEAISKLASAAGAQLRRL